MSDSDKEKINYPASDEIVNNLNKLGLSVPIWDREVTAAEIQYFLDRWPFLQILSINSVDSLDDVQLVSAKKSNWTILNYGDAMASSPGEFLFGGGDFTIKPLNPDDDDRDGDGLLNPDKGTVFRQAYATAEEMVSLAKTLGWEGIHVVDGNPLMKWAVWMHSLDGELNLTGFEPSHRDQERRERVKRSELDEAKLFAKKAPRL